MIDKGVCDREFICNPNNCECECDKSCDIGEYLDHENCKFRKKLVDKLVEECTENIEETRLIEKTSAKNKNKRKCSSCTLYIVLFWIIFTINVGIGTYFIYCHWYLKNDDARVILGTRTETTIYGTYKWDKSNKLTLKMKDIFFLTTWLI